MSDMSTDCAFCEIVQRDPKEQVLHRLEGCVVFEPLSPCTPGHLLVVPEEHVVDAADRIDVFARASGVAAALARQLQDDGLDCNVVTNSGRAAGQTVFHLHVHVVPRRRGDGLGYRWGGQ